MVLGVEVGVSEASGVCEGVVEGVSDETPDEPWELAEFDWEATPPDAS